MEIRISSKQILTILYVIAWIIFIGLCVEAGSYVVSAVMTMLINKKHAAYFKLTDLFNHDSGYYLVIMSIMIIIAVLKAIMFYQIVKILRDKKLDMAQPFNKDMGRFIFIVAYLALGIGFFTHLGMKNITWLMSQGISMPQVQPLGFAGADVWLFMGITLLVIAQIFKRGIEIQTENELTI